MGDERANGGAGAGVRKLYLTPGPSPHVERGENNAGLEVPSLSNGEGIFEG